MQLLSTSCVTRVWMIALFASTTLTLAAQKIDTIRVDEADVARESKFISAIQARLQGNFDESADILSDLIAEDDNAAYHYELALVERNRDQPIEALKMLRRAIALDDQNEWHWQLMVEIADELDDAELAIEAYRTLLDLHPDRLTYLEHLALQHLTMGQVDESLRYIDQIESHTGPTLETTRRRHQIYDRLGRKEEALAAMTSYLERVPWDTDMIHAAAAYADHNGMKEAASALYRQLLADNPQDVVAIQGINKIEGQSIEQDDLDALLTRSNLSLDDKMKLLLPTIEAMSADKTPVDTVWMTRAQKLDQLHGPHVKTKALIGDLHYLKGNRQAAIAAYSSAVELDPNHFHVWDQLLSLLAQTGDWPAVASAAEEAMEYFPNQATPYAYLARSQASAGDSASLAAEARMIAGGHRPTLDAIERILNLP